MMEEDYFEHEYEDDLDALRDMEMEENAAPSATKRSLFEKDTPKRPEKKITDLDDSFPTPLGSQSPGQANYDSKTPKRRFDALSPKRRLNNSSESFKKAKTNDEDVYSADDVRLDDSEIMQATPYRRGVRPTEFPQMSPIQPAPMSSDQSRKAIRLHRRIPEGEYLPVTGSDGVRTGYLRIGKLEEDDIKTTSSSATYKPVSCSFLSVDIHTLKARLEEKRCRDTLDKLRRIDDITTSVLNRNDLTTEYDDAPCDDDDADSGGICGSNKLWVDAYAPKLYVDLMSDETVNRVLLKWVKMWDYVVFNKQKPNRMVGGTAKKLGTRAVNGAKPDMKALMKKKYEDMGLDENFDALYRPQQKVVLLCGRPGLGKTTLAHIVARHAGYNVIEINASDERTATSFKNRIDDCLTTKPLLGVTDTPRPNCLIIDEIDGAPAPAVNALISKLSTSTNSSESKKGKSSPILRPIICVCNDLYTPSLRPLRQMALVINFPPQCPSLLASRLHEVCRNEGIQADMSTLITLSKKSGGDIRSCLNTLQFLRRSRQGLTVKNLMSLNIGDKDEQRSLFNFWQKVFQVPRSDRTVLLPSVYDNEFTSIKDLKTNDDSLDGRMSHIYREAASCGEFNKVVQGLHENFIHMKYKDPFMRSINMGADWLCYTDIINKRVMSQQLYLLSGYLPYLAVVFHLNFAQVNYPKITYPKVHYEVSSRRNHMNELISTMCQNVLPQVYQHVNRWTLSADLLPALVDIIIQPSMRPVNIQLYSVAEKKQLNDVVSIMIAYNLTYIQHKGEEGQYIFTLEPPMYEAIRYPDIKLSRKSLSYTAKQLIANEIQQEKQRRMDNRSSTLQGDETPSTPKSSTKLSTPSFEASNGTPHRDGKINAAKDATTPNHRQKLIPKNITPSQRGAKDFFGRPIKECTKAPSAEVLKARRDRGLLHTDIWFRYNQGFSNAVRKKVTISDLL